MNGKIKDKYPYIINILSYGIYQVVNLILLIIMIPFFIETYGVDKFGIIAIGQAVGIIVAAICDYNYMITGVREIAANNNNKDLISRLITESIISKMLILLVIFILGSALFYSIERTRIIITDVQIGIIYGFSVSLIPVWALNALHFNLPLAIFSTPVRLITILLIYHTLRENNDYQMVNVYLTLGNLLAAIAIYQYISFKKNISYSQFSWSSIISNFQKGIYLCLSNICTATYMNMNALILSLYVSPYFIGVFSVADKIINGGRQILSISSNIIYPYACKAILKKEYLRSFFFPVFGTFLLFICGGVLIAFFMRTELLSLVGSPHVAKEAEYIFILLLCSLPLVATNIPFTQYLNATRRENTVSMIAIFTCLISLTFNFLLSKHFAEIGTSFSVILTELFCTLFLIFKAFRS